MNDTEDPIAWLLRQVDEDERLAQAAQIRTEPPWSREPWPESPLPEADGVVDRNGDGIVVARGSCIGEHIVNWDPARVLAECEAKRRVAEAHCPVVASSRVPHGRACLICHWPSDWPCQTLKLLAQPYAGREGFPGELRVEKPNGAPLIASRISPQ